MRGNYLKIGIVAVILVVLMIVLITAAGWIITSNFYNQQTKIYEVVTAKEVIYHPGTNIPLQPIPEDVFNTDTEVIYACANVTSTPFESVLYVRWYGIYGGKKVIEDSDVIECHVEGCWRCFNITKPRDGWKVGNYDVIFQINEDISALTKFKIIKKQEA